MKLKNKNFKHKHKRPISIKDVDINKTLVPNKVSFGKNCFKCFTANKDEKNNNNNKNKKIKWLCRFLPKFRLLGN